ncbi:hypothetical protein K437DRAFT_254455 [Tilletiaria anomala UBC 951]|uniref:Uncharacterized protein n=1 Tax=Tilletiaria anomala (strain ATCC 24038 / CBS 436.72 / UBC 951) TaxID=1037660 RepID=A0A066WIB6_TILAU|nr:uncharacterized protein K437DRAFT_254455 [Tilletiaria anomala UBC 951]KDN52268.1 hypothetical protein K437DRAFT_254455 [Tilletiaria anomala UBC 951]
MAFLLNAALSMTASAYRAGTSLFGTHTAATDTHLSILHSPLLVLYRGSETYVSVTVLEFEKGGAGKQRRDGGVQVSLIRRGWRAGIFGWAIAKYLGAKTVKGIDVTPATEHGRPNSKSALEGGESSGSRARTAFPAKQLESYEKETRQFVQDQAKTTHELLCDGVSSISQRNVVPVATHIVRIPARANDGYFRIAFCYSDGSVSVSPDFRIFSFSLSSACPRGAALLPPTIAPELILRALSTALHAFLLGLFPIAAILEKILPRAWTRRFMRWAYNRIGGDERKDKLLEKYEMKERLGKATESFYETVPFASAGVRTSHDLAKDQEYGIGGVTYWR